MSTPDPLLPDEPWPQRISRIFAWFAGACILFGCGALISADVVTRFIFKRGMIESFEISGYMLAACIGLGLAFTVTSKSNIRVDILLDAFPYRLRAACDLLAAIALAVIAVALVWFCLENPGAVMEHECPVDLHHADADGAAARRLVDRPAVVRVHGRAAAAAGRYCVFWQRTSAASTN